MNIYIICTSIMTCLLGVIVYILAQDIKDEILKGKYSIIGVVLVLLGLILIF